MIKPTYIIINLLIVLVLSQIYVNFSIFRVHFLVSIFVFSLLGILIGCYFSFETSDYVLPSLDLPPNNSADKLNYLLSYKLNNDLCSSNYLQKLGRADNRISLSKEKSFFSRPLSSNQKSFFSQNQKEFMSHDSFSANSEFIENYFDKNEQFSSLLEADNEFYLNDDDANEQFSLDQNEFNNEKDAQSSTKLDSYLDETVQLIIRDFVLSWLSRFIWENETEKFASMAKHELKQLISSFIKRLQHLDYVKLISRDLIFKFNHHFFNVRKSSNMNERFKLNYYEMDPGKECEHLRNLIELLILNVYNDKNYFKNNALRSLLREVLVNKIIYTSIEFMCDPDYLNQKLINYLTDKENLRLSLNLNQKFSYVSSYEEFIRIIKTSKNVDEIKQYHYKIMNEIMQATIINDFKDGKFSTTEGSSGTSNKNSSTSANNFSIANSTGFIASGSSSFYASFSMDSNMTAKTSQATDKKADMLKSKDYKHYLKQLRYAKLLCERRLNTLNNSKTKFFDDSIETNFENTLKNRKILPFDTVMSSKNGQASFLKFLEPDGSDALLRFWLDVEKLKKFKLPNIKKKYELANSIYENYLKKYDSPVRDEIGKDTYKSMQLFLLGNNTDEGFIKAQEKIKKVLESDHYSSFIVTDSYEKLIKEFDVVAETDLAASDANRNRNQPSSSSNGSNELFQSNNMDVNQKQIDALKEKLSMKLSALNAIKTNSSQQEDSKIAEILENDIKKLKYDISVYQTHIQKTEAWCENLGKWTTHVVNARIMPANESSLITGNNSNTIANSNESIILFEIQVQLHDETTSKESGEADTKNRFKDGWVIYRSLKQFESLQESLDELVPVRIKNKLKKMPNLKRSLLSKNYDEEKIKQATFILDDFIRSLSEDESLSQSEALYTFLCPSPDYLKNKADKSSHQASSNDESSGSIFKGAKPKELSDDDFLDSLFADTDLKALDANARDSIAEPFYYLIEEIFEIRGMKKLFRKSLILFVQLTYGATINAKIRESIYWLFSDEMFANFVIKLKDSFWKLNSVTTELELIKYQASTRTAEEKAQTKKLAKLKLIANIPDTLQKLVGEKNAQIGVIRLFETFQDKKLNKHLAYSLLEMFISEICNEAT